MLHAKYQRLDVQLFMSSLSNFDRALDKGQISVKPIQVKKGEYVFKELLMTPRMLPNNLR